MQKSEFRLSFSLGFVRELDPLATAQSFIYSIIYYLFSIWAFRLIIEQRDCKNATFNT